GLPDSGQGHTILRTLGSGNARLDSTQIQVEHFVEQRLRVCVGSEQTLLSGVSLDQIDKRAPTRQLQIAQRVRIDWEQRRGRAEFRWHVRECGPVGDGESAQSWSEELDEFAHHAVCSE